MLNLKYLLLTNTGIDEIESFLDFLADWGWRRDMFASRVEASFVSGVMNRDNLTFGACVRVTSLLHERLHPVFTFAGSLDVAALFRDYVIASLVAEKPKSSHYMQMSAEPQKHE